MRIVDSDVVIYAMMVSQTLWVEDKFWKEFGTRKYFSYLAIHYMVSIKKSHHMGNRQISKTTFYESSKYCMKALKK